MRVLIIVFSLMFLSAAQATLAQTAAKTPVPELDPGKKMLQEVQSRIKTISTEDLKRMIDNKEDFVLLDVRMPSDIDSMGWIDAPQQLEIARGWIESRIFNHLDFKKDMNKPIVAYCGGGIRSAFAADTLQQLGFKKVYNYDAGFFDWEAKGHPVKYKQKK